VASQPSEESAEPVRGLSFGSVAKDYERYRLSYPGELVDAVAAYARGRLGNALEVGAGTGKATRLFAARGIAVTALEPDAEMARVLKRTTQGMPVQTVLSTLESFATGSRFDLVYAAAAWHWTDPASRWARAVELLVPHGVLALFGALAEPQNPDLRAAIDQIERELLPDNGESVGHPWSGEDMAAVDGLIDIAQRDLSYVATTTAEEFMGGLATVSSYLMLSAHARTEALRRIHAVLPNHVQVDVAVTLSLARRAQPPQAPPAM
jgi:SAM-dependent methyltransferase